MSSLDHVYFKQKKMLFSLYKNNLPQSIILSGGEIDLLSDIAISFSELIVKNNNDQIFWLTITFGILYIVLAKLILPLKPP